MKHIPVEFNNETHSYYYEGVRVPSVTQVINYCDDVFAYVRKSVLDRACARGTAVHEYIENYFNGEPPAIEDEYGGFMEAFLSWEKNFDYTLISCEQVLCGIEDSYKHIPIDLAFAGTTDLIASVCGKVTLIDFKTGARHRHHDIQISAYGRLAKQKIEKYMLVYLSKNGTYRLRMYEPDHMEESYSIFIDKLITFYTEAI